MENAYINSNLNVGKGTGEGGALRNCILSDSLKLTGNKGGRKTIVKIEDKWFSKNRIPSSFSLHQQGSLASESFSKTNGMVPFLCFRQIGLMPKAEAKRVEMIDLASIKDVLLSVHYSDSKWTAERRYNKLHASTQYYFLEREMTLS